MRFILSLRSDWKTPIKSPNLKLFRLTTRKSWLDRGNMWDFRKVQNYRICVCLPRWALIVGPSLFPPWPVFQVIIFSLSSTQPVSFPISSCVHFSSVLCSAISMRLTEENIAKIANAVPCLSIHVYKCNKTSSHVNSLCIVCEDDYHL